MKFIQIQFIDCYDGSKDQDSIVVADEDFDKAVKIINDSQDGWKDLTKEERYEEYGGYFDYVADCLDKKQIKWNWLSYDADITIRY